MNNIQLVFAVISSLLSFLVMTIAFSYAIASSEDGNKRVACAFLGFLCFMWVMFGIYCVNS